MLTSSNYLENFTKYNAIQCSWIKVGILSNRDLSNNAMLNRRFIHLQIMHCLIEDLFIYNNLNVNFKFKKLTLLI